MVIPINKISLRLGFWFFVIILILESFLFFFLHSNIVDSRVEEELNALQARGNSHRDVVEKSFKSDTLHHVALMEAQADTEVVITDQNNDILVTSNNLDNEEQKIITTKVKDVPRQGSILEDRWRTEKYISTISPYFINDHNYGYVFMFQSTDQVQSLISKLNRHFVIAAILTITFMILTIISLTRVLTKPLIKMKKATEKISKGDFTVNLPEMGKDELGDLAKSITVLSTDLKHLKEDRNEFLANISHELRTPITYIKGYADIARRDNLDKHDRRKYLDIIFEESEKLSDMIKDLFDLARIDKNTFTINKEIVNLSLFLHTLYEKMLPAFQEKRIHLDLECEANLKVNVDPMRFEQIILNLLDNSIKYSPIETTTSIHAYKDKGNVCIEIKDEGYGIPTEDLPFIFERFYRVEKSRSRGFGGSGLGLAIVKELVDAHQDSAIQVESQLGEGTRFLITLGEVRQ